MPTPARHQDDEFYQSMHALDHVREALVACLTMGLSPESLLMAWADWSIHLAGAPGKRLELEALAIGGLRGLMTEPRCLQPADSRASLTDQRFVAPAWQHEPFLSWAQGFLLTEQWWRQATRGVPGTERHHEDVVAFFARQWLDLMAPSNLLWTNPEVLEVTVRQNGLNLVRGASHFLEDAQRRLVGAPPVGCDAFVTGRDLACTPGKVVYRNQLMELLQYRPLTPTVYAEPILMVPAWIMKYYILDLSAHNSLVRWLVAKGHTVFCISWRNVTAADRDLGMDDYRRLGLMAAIDTVASIVPGKTIHAMGYCLGGTLLALAAAAMARSGDRRLASITLLAAQTDFTEPGELQLFMDAAQVHLLDSMMWLRGCLTAEQMSSAFQMLRSNDLVWSRMLREYMQGERIPVTDLMAWNADATRLPQRMHSEYLHRLFLNNELATGRYLVDGHPVALQNIRTPIFALGTERDHVSPWRSVYKIHYLTDTEVSFLLTSGGHNAGIVSEPGHANRHFRLHVKAPGDICLSADEWYHSARPQTGSWWPLWRQWLVRHSTARRSAPPALGMADRAADMDAPGSYVMQR